MAGGGATRGPREGPSDRQAGQAGAESRGGHRHTYLFTTQLPWTSIATFWMPRRTATESVEGPRRLIKLAKGMTFTEKGGRRAISQGNGPGLPVPHQACRTGSSQISPAHGR